MISQQFYHSHIFNKINFNYMKIYLAIDILKSYSYQYNIK